jgi:hypothetical protein
MRSPRSGRDLSIALGVIVPLVLSLALTACARSPESSPPQSAEPPLDSPHTAKVPGPACDQTGSVLWATGNQHRQNGIDVNDPYTSVVCQADGLEISRTADYGVFGSVFFENPDGEPLPNAYRVEVTGRVTHGDANAVIGLGVHGQSKYGADDIDVTSDGRWWVAPVDNATGEERAPLASGNLARKPSAGSITIAAEVDGPRIAVTVDGQQIPTVTDPNDTTTSHLQFGVSDPGATASPSALFSNFSYAPAGSVA